MNSIRTLLAALTLTVVSFAAAAQVAPQFEIGPGKGTVVGPQAADIAAKKAAAEQWLAKDQFVIRWEPGAGSGSTAQPQEYAVYPKQGKTIFHGAKSSCVRGDIATNVSVDEKGDMILTFNVTLAGCNTVVYKFDPLTKEGQSYTVDVAKQSTQTSSKLSLR